ncbi:MAG: hypothetical protein KJ597_02255 [Nanoarchaeota archaeon]|nr:hypothetical protein [Nanoarchaeota archaeon]MBU1622374.1 hypothetical protein [Nanoarchaeota archaeon]
MAQMKTYTIKVEEDLYYLLRRLKADTVRKILRNAVDSKTFRYELAKEFEKQIDYHLKSMNFKMGEINELRKQADFILNDNKKKILVEVKTSKGNK